MSTDQSLARIGAGAALVGAVMLLVATLLHPLGSDPNDPPAAFAEYATDSIWVWSHLGQFVGFAVLGMALVALAATLETGRAVAWARIGVAGTGASVAVAAALQAVDGLALKVMVDRWAAATGEARELAFEAAFAVRQIEIGLASLLSLLSGFTLTVFAVATILSARYPLWLGGIGLWVALGRSGPGSPGVHWLFGPGDDVELAGEFRPPHLGRRGRHSHVAAGPSARRSQRCCMRVLLLASAGCIAGAPRGAMRHWASLP